MTHQQSVDRQSGYAMVALLVGIAVMGVMLSMAMPVWRTMVQREREEELVFRGMQYARAIGLYQRKYAGAYPPSVQLLIEQKFLRKKDTDPMVRDSKGKEAEFRVLYQSSVQRQPGQVGRGRNAVGGGTGGIGSGTAAGNEEDPAASSQLARNIGAGPRGGIAGVASTSKDRSFRLYNGRSVYREREFLWNQDKQGTATAARPGEPARSGSSIRSRQ
jgi:type II secretory pathway pseudopilin PulG